MLGQTDGAGGGNAFQSRGDVDAIAHQIAVALLDHIAEMDADAELDAALGRKAGVALDHTVLHFDGTAHGIDHAAELNDSSVAGALDHAPIMDAFVCDRPSRTRCIPAHSCKEIKKTDRAAAFFCALWSGKALLRGVRPTHRNGAGV